MLNEVSEHSDSIAWREPQHLRDDFLDRVGREPGHQCNPSERALSRQARGMRAGLNVTQRGVRKVRGQCREHCGAIELENVFALTNITQCLLVFSERR